MGRWYIYYRICVFWVDGRLFLVVERVERLRDAVRGEGGRRMSTGFYVSMLYFKANTLYIDLVDLVLFDFDGFCFGMIGRSSRPR